MTLRHRVTPRGLRAFARCARAQHRHLHAPWRDAIRVAWHYGPVR